MQIRRSARIIIMLVPLVYTVHELEEYLTALPWLRQHSSEIPTFMAQAVPDSATFILVAGAIFFMVFMGAGLLMLRDPDSRWWTALFGILIVARLENAFVHVGQSVLFQSYTPGVITAVLVVGPISVVVLRELVQHGMLKWASLLWMAPAALLVQVAAIALLVWPAFSRDAS
jgi:hypothetical protein